MSTECVAIIGAIATVFAGLGGAALGAHFAYKNGIKLVKETHKNAIELIQRQEHNKAASDFKNAFLPEIIFMKHNANIGNIGSTDDLSEVLRFGYLHRHLKAFEVFKDYLSTENKAGIDKAWMQYCYNQENPEILFFEQYFTGMCSKKEKEEKKQLALDRINTILEFANHK